MKEHFEPSCRAIKVGSASLFCCGLLGASILIGCSSDKAGPAHASNSPAVETAPLTDVETKIAMSADERIARHRILVARLEAIDKAHPGLSPPRGAKPLQVIEVTEDGVFKLVGGERVAMDGIDCTPQFFSQLRKVLVRDDAGIVFTPSSSARPESSNKPLRGWVWAAYVDPESKDGVVYSSVFESGISNKDCTSKHSETSRFNERFRALSEEALTRPR